MPDPHQPDLDPAEVAAAEELDRAIDAVLAGRAGPAVASELGWLTAAVRTDPPPALAAGVEASHERVLRRRWRPVRYAAAALAYLLISQGVGNFFVSDWVARGIGEAHSPHLAREGGFALVAAGIAVLAGVLWRRMLPVSVATGTPLAVGLGFMGISEIGVFAPGAVLHLSQGVVGIALAALFWKVRRDTRGPRDEERA